MVLRITSEFALDVIDKLLGFPVVFSQKGLEVGTKNGASILEIIFMLSPLIVDYPTEKRGYKQGTTGPDGFRYIIMVVALLTKVIAVYV